MSASLNTIEFGVLLPAGAYQLLDATGPVDYINTNARGFISGLATPVPEAHIAKAPVINWHWISAAGNLQPVQATSGPPLTPTTNFTAAPQLDYLLVPGPDPFLELSAEATQWLKTQYVGLKGLLTVCTGSLYLAQTGLLDGVQAATNKVTLRRIASGPNYGKFSKVKWVRDARFVVDGKIWTAAGVTAGLDLAAEFVRVHVDPEVVKSVQEGILLPLLPVVRNLTVTGPNFVALLRAPAWEEWFETQWDEFYPRFAKLRVSHYRDADGIATSTDSVFTMEDFFCAFFEGCHFEMLTMERVSSSVVNAYLEFVPPPPSFLVPDEGERWDVTHIFIGCDIGSPDVWPQDPRLDKVITRDSIQISHISNPSTLTVYLDLAANDVYGLWISDCPGFDDSVVRHLVSKTAVAVARYPI